MTNEDDLHQLAVAARDRGTTGALLTALVPLLRRYCGRVLARYGRRDWAEDMVQEVLLSVHLKLHTFDPAQPFEAWLYAVAKHKIIDAMRRERIRAVPLEEAAMLSDSQDSEAALARRDLTQLLGRLKPPAGDIILALKVDGVSVKTLAERFATSESNIKIIVHRGLARLARMLNEATHADR
jgi:RNA polymerase sigma-70 factor (ECF subfamily)